MIISLFIQQIYIFSIFQQCSGINVFVFLKKFSEDIMNKIDNVKCQGGK